LTIPGLQRITPLRYVLRSARETRSDQFGSSPLSSRRSSSSSSSVTGTA